MADRYQDQPFAADDHYDHGGNPHAPGRVESDPLAELARLIGQADPFGGAPKAPPHPQPRPQPLQSRANVRPQQQYETQAEEDEGVPAGPPPWMQRARQEPPQPVAAPQEHYQEHYEEQEPEYQPSPVHPLHRYAAQHVAPEPEYREDLPFPDAGQEPDPSRYDDALYGRIESGEQDFQRDPAYPEDPYAYQSGYEEEEPAPRKRSGLMAVVAVLALAVVGTGAAFAYRTYVGSPRSGEPPIIKADNSPTKIVPAPADGVAKTPDRMVPGDGAEKLVSREETPVDVTAKTGGPRVVFPPLNPNSNPPSVASVSPTTPPPPMAANGTMPNSEPRKIRTLSVKGDAADAGIPASASPPPAKQPATAAAKPGAPRNANASANTPLALTPGAPPDSAPAPARVASTNPAPAASGGGGYVVQVSSQKNEADAQASYRALQSKFPSVLGSRAPLIKRADLGDKGVYYRAMVGPFGSPDEASQFCGSLKSAGGQCVVQRN